MRSTRDKSPQEGEQMAACLRGLVMRLVLIFVLLPGLVRADAFSDFYLARDAAELVARASAGHGLMAELALLGGDDVATFKHLVLALKGNEKPAIYLLNLFRNVYLSSNDMEQLVRLHKGLAASHEDPEVRAVAAFTLARLLYLQGDTVAMKEALSKAGLVLPLHVIGTFDNDQGKGLDVEFPPEREIDLKARYQGALLDIGWRKAQTQPLGQVELDELMAPTQWSVAYAVSAVAVEREGDYEVRLTTSDPFKLFVDGVLVMEERELDATGMIPDAFVVRVHLGKGPHRILVKSAQREGDWVIRVRLSGPGGSVPEAVSPIAPDTEPLAPLRQFSRLDPDTVFRDVEEGPGRDLMKARWLLWVGLREKAVEAAQEFVDRHPYSVIGRFVLASALWSKGERDKVADLLSDLDREVGSQLPYIRLKRAEFLRQQGLDHSARTAILSVRQAFPNLAEAAIQLANYFADQGFREDQCQALKAAEQARPGTIHVRMKLASCLWSLGHLDQAEGYYQRVVDEMPNYVPALSRLADLMRDKGDLAAAERYASLVVRSNASLLRGWMDLAEIRRRRGDREGAEAAIRRAQELSPDRADTYKLLGSTAWELEDRAAAVKAWEAALERNPKDEKLANRLDYMCQDTKGPLAEAPDDKAIEEAIAKGAQLVAQRGADVVVLLDHQVMELRPDGSTTSLVTMVEKAVNQEGRDAITRFKMGGGRVRLLKAFAVALSGRRAEASSIKGREILFRAMEPGSIVVVQYRADDPPAGHLARHLSTSWWFATMGRQVLESTFVLYLPAGTKVHESLQGPVKREERQVGDKVRIAWTAMDLPPVLPEPGMPAAIEFLPRLLLSTVPDWDTFLKWEEALLQGVFRQSPEIRDLAERLFPPDITAGEKLFRVQEFMLSEIRYQQDYESMIAGVRPHTAPMVLERKYGDCKDKAVLFMTLARLAGIKAHFALVRTRGEGPVVKEVPMQQFNHAIVYVPPQEGIPEGRFFDPTADALDVFALRPDVPGTSSLVLDQDRHANEWIDIPFDPPGTHRFETEVTLELRKDGSAKGQVRWHANGMFGATLRRLARNQDRLVQSMRQEVGKLVSGGETSEITPVEVTSLRKPAVVQATVASPSAARITGREMRMEVPTGWHARDVMPIGERHHDVVLPVPHERTWDVKIGLPKGARLTGRPSQGRVESRCLVFSRDVETAPGYVRIRQSFTSLCERIPVAEYPQHRASVEEIDRMLTEDLLLQW